MNRLERSRLFIIIALVVVVILVWLPYFYTPQQTDCYCLQVSFLDVGQGDAIYIKSPEGFDVLVDGGPDASVLRSLASVQSWQDRTLDIVIATHTDADHIGGLIDIFERYQVNRVIETSNQNDTATAVRYDLVSQEGQTFDADAGQQIRLGSSTILTVLSPTGDESQWESNTASIVLLVQFGETKFLLTGDAPSGIEEYLVGAYAPYLKSDVLKLGHHGSNTSSSELFLTTVDPEFAIVSAGADNRYGHPHPEVVSRVEAVGATILETATQGTITFYSDGISVWRE